jgi:CUB/sushi domain-containing protein
MKSSDTTKKGTPISYASSASDNDFLIYDYNDFQIYRGGSYVTTGVSANDGNWHHIVVTWRSSDGQVKLYKDGEAYSGTLATGTSITDGGSIVFAQEQDSVGGGFDSTQAFLGIIDEVMIFNEALTPDEVISLRMR